MNTIACPLPRRARFRERSEFDIRKPLTGRGERSAPNRLSSLHLPCHKYDSAGKVTHQRFIEGGIITGTPNQLIPKVP